MKPAALLAFTLTIVIAAFAIFAQAIKWHIDSDHSTASIFLAQSGDPDPGLNIAVAMAAGTMNLDSADPSKLSFQFTIFPADQKKALLNPDGTFRPGAYAALSRYSLMSFHSKTAFREQSGKLRIMGDLTVTYVEREAPADGNVAYGGPVLITPVAETAAGEVTFTFDKLLSEIVHGQKVAWLQMTGLGKIELEDLPTLQEWLSRSVWPMVVEDRDCYMPNYSASMRDYNGAVCTGKLVETKPPEQAPHSFGVDYSGPRSETPKRVNEVRILLDLKLRPQAPGS